MRLPSGGHDFNHVDGVRHDVPKPILYSRFVVPESPARLQRMRRTLRQLVERLPATLLVSHHQAQIEATGIPAWASGSPGARGARSER